MNQFLSNKIIAGIVAVALLVGVGVLVSSGDTSSTTRNTALVVATPCTKPGQVTKVSKQSVVCATTDAGSLWYATMKAKGKAQACKSPGAIRQKSNIVWVCGVIKKKKLWQATQPLTALAVKGDLPSTTPATPDAPVNADNTVLAEPAVIDTAATQTLVPAVPTALSLETQPLGGVNALALETQPVVQLLDQRGASISTAGITITAVPDRTDVVLSGNTAITDATGRATFTALSLKGVMGEIALAFTAPRLGLEGVTSGNLVLAAGVATKLVSDTKLGAVATGQLLNPFPKLHLEDSSGNVVALSGRDVVVTSTKEGPYGYTTVATASDGYVFFLDLTLIETGATTLTFTSGDLSTTSTVMVKPGDSQKLKITTEASESATNNVAFAQSPVVQLLDADGNNVTTAGITVTATITQFPAGATATTSTLFVSTGVTNAQGVATFTGLGIKGLIGTYKLGFTPAGGLTQASDKTVTLKSGDLKKLIVLTAAAGPVGNSTAGTWSLTQSPVIGLRDISNNEVIKSGVTVTATVTGQDPTFSAVTDDQGKATFPIIFSGNDAGSRTITYKASNVNIDLTADITLPLLASVVSVALTVPTGINTTSDAFTLRPPTSNSTTGVWGYTSSNEAIATVTSTGTVTPKEVAGEVTITATQAATKYASATSTANLVIARTSTVVKQPLAYPFNYDTTSGPFSPLPSQLPTSDSGGVWTYTSDKPTIATVDRESGRVTPKGVAGTVKITATQAETPKYTSISTSKDLVIYYQALVYPSGKNLGSDPFDPLTLPASKSTVPWTYTSLNSDIATVDRTSGRVTPKGVAGTVTIKATQVASSPYEEIKSDFSFDIPLIPVVVGSFTGEEYWSSTEFGLGSDTLCCFTKGGLWSQGSKAKSYGSGSVRPVRAFGASSPSTTPTPAIPLTCATGGTCKVGDTGPGGGIVFYVHAGDPFTSTGSDCDSNCRYLEAAPLDHSSKVAWCSNTSKYFGLTGIDIGSGMSNTTTARTTCTSGAIYVAAEYSNNNKTDWHLPSMKELVQLYDQKTVVSPASWVLRNRYTDSAAFTTPITSNSNGAWTYTSDKPTIATVDGSTGRVTPKGVAGTVKITATHAATSRYAAATITADLSIYKTYQVGEAGPGGGTVFYNAGTPQTWGRYLEVAPADIQRTVNSGYEPARVNFFGEYSQPSCAQWTWPNSISNETDPGIGTGKANTEKILKCLRAQFRDRPFSDELPAVLANKYSTNTAGAGQWFLPSKDELNQLCKIYSNGRTDTAQFMGWKQDGCTGSRSPTGGFAAADNGTDFYWSSTVGIEQTLERRGFAWNQTFYNGTQDNHFTWAAGLVRPVRAF